MTITFERAENHGEETTNYVHPNDTELAQQKMDFAQQRSDLLKFLASCEQPVSSASGNNRTGP